MEEGLEAEKLFFHLKNMWLKVEGFEDLVKNLWTSYNFRGSCSYILASKLKALKRDLKVWNREVIGNVSLIKNTALSRIGFWDTKERDSGWSLVRGF